MRRLLIAVVMCCVWASMGMAQDKTVESKPPVLSPDSKVALLKLQLRQKQIEVQYRQLDAQMKGLQQEYEGTQKDLAVAQAEATALAHADTDQWILNLDTLEFVRKVVPAASSVPPATPTPKETKKP